MSEDTLIENPTETPPTPAPPAPPAPTPAELTTTAPDPPAPPPTVAELLAQEPQVVNIFLRRDQKLGGELVRAGTRLFQVAVPPVPGATLNFLIDGVRNGVLSDVLPGA